MSSASGSFDSSGFDSGSFDSGTFRAALGKFGTGVTVITACSEEGPVGITVNSFASVSLDPPLVLWSLGRSSGRTAIFEKAEHFAIHVLSAQQEPLCRGFASSWDAFDTAKTNENEFGVPLIRDCLARFECSRHSMHEGGDHLIFVARVERVAKADGQPLIFFDRAFGSFGGEIALAKSA